MNACFLRRDRDSRLCTMRRAHSPAHSAHLLADVSRVNDDADPRYSRRERVVQGAHTAKEKPGIRAWVHHSLDSRLVRDAPRVCVDSTDRCSLNAF